VKGSIALWSLPFQVRWALVSMLAEVCSGQVSSTSEIITDRPDITESSVVIPAGSVQVENGVTRSADHGTLTADLPETLIRVGILGRTEIRITPPNYIRQVSGCRLISSFGDPSIGLKKQIGPLAGAFDLSVIIGSGITLEANEPAGHTFSPFIKLPWSHDLAKGWSIGGMQSLFYGSEVPNKFTWESTFFVEREIIKRSDIFFEYGADYGPGAESRQVLHIGAARRVTPRQQVDFHFGFGLTHGSPDHFLAAGYSLRVDHLFGRRN
jgi:hypothetical protein